VRSKRNVLSNPPQLARLGGQDIAALEKPRSPKPNACVMFSVFLRESG